MEQPQPEADPIREARQAIEAVRGLLLKGTPDALHAGVPHLERAAGFLEQLRNGVSQGSAASRPLLESLAHLRKEISHIVHLIDSSAMFYHGWWTAPETGSDDYTPAGERTSAASAHTLSLQG